MNAKAYASRCIPLLLFTAVLCMPAAPASAQEASRPIIYASYFECDGGSGTMADRLIRNDFAPVVERHVAAGHLTTWGWLSHNTGGAWDRAIYYIAPTGDAVIDALDAIFEEFGGDNAVVGREFNRICPKHEDYIWRNVAGSDAPSQLAQVRRAAGMSSYFECDPSREDRTDEIVTGTFAPVLNALVEDGTIGAWSWNAHVVGGPYRRLLVYDGPDHKTLLKAVARINQRLDADAPNESREFSEICNRHQDYMWDITTAQQ